MATLTLVLSIFAREAAPIFLAIRALLAWRDRDRLMLGISVIGLVVTVALEQAIAASAPPNPYHIPEFLYTLAKVPIWLVRYTGLFIDTSANLHRCGHPETSFHLPHHLGHIRDILVCRFDANQPVTLLAGWLTEFGTLPALAFLVLGESRCNWHRAATWEKFALTVGLFFFIVGPFTGSGFPRLVAPAGVAWAAALHGGDSSRLATPTFVAFILLGGYLLAAAPAVAALGGASLPPSLLLLLGAAGWLITWRAWRSIAPVARPGMKQHLATE